MTSRHTLREYAMVTVYQYLVVERDLNALIEDTFHKPVSEVDPYFIKLIDTALAHKDEYKTYINQVIKTGWTFDRLGTVEQAILLNGCAEFDMKQTEAAVIIDESVEMAKKYCDEDAYKLINSVLDVI